MEVWRIQNFTLRAELGGSPSNIQFSITLTHRLLILLAMGIWDFISSTTEAVKRQAPDPTPIKEAYKTSYDFCSSATGKIDNLVKANSQRLNDYLSDEETRAQIGLYTSKFLQNAALYAQQEGYKMVPGGEALAKIVSETTHDVKLEKQNKQEMEAMKEIFGGGGGGKNPASFLEQVEMQRRGMESGYENANQSPKDLLNNFMMKEFMGNRLADELVLPQIKNIKKN